MVKRPLGAAKLIAPAPFMLTELQYRILRAIAPSVNDHFEHSAFEGKSKLKVQLGENILNRIQGLRVADFGCGEGSEAIEMAQFGAKEVIGLDIQEEMLVMAREKARVAGVDQICKFAQTTAEPVDCVLSLDAFEHFGDPLAILEAMGRVLKPDGIAIICFGPVWRHPLGGHLFSVFPWAHLLFSEKALIRWRSDFKTDGATRFSEVAGGLNQMTIRRFEKIIAQSPFRFQTLELVPIRQLQRIHSRLTREFTTAVVRCQLVKS